MWDVLVEALAVDDTHAEERIALIDATHEGRVDQALLDRVQPLLDRALGRPCRAILIPHGRSNDEQLAILEAIAGELASGARVNIDITHGYRHLSMIGQVAARHLRHTRSVHVEGIWYGAVEMTDPATQITPVLRLDGLDRIQDWVEAFARFDASGDYGVFAPLLAADGLAADKAQSLIDAYFHESCANLSDARRKLLTVLQALEQPLSGASRLFQHKLIEKLDWARRDDLGANQRTLALRALGRGDVLRAATLGLESVVTQYCQQRRLDPHDYRQREDARRQLQEHVRDASDDRWLDAYRTLNGLRNAIAHGTPPRLQTVDADHEAPRRPRRRNPPPDRPPAQPQLNRPATRPSAFTNLPTSKPRSSCGNLSVFPHQQ